ncbi:MAG: hypothetical protein WBA93_32730 [Microcoleaceae cyanobacterium]
MIETKVLLTSFDIWKPEHQSNSSDNLLSQISAQKLRDIFQQLIINN